MSTHTKPPASCTPPPHTHLATTMINTVTTFVAWVSDHLMRHVANFAQKCFSYVAPQPIYDKEIVFDAEDYAMNKDTMPTEAEATVKVLSDKPTEADTTAKLLSAKPMEADATAKVLSAKPMEATCTHTEADTINTNSMPTEADTINTNIMPMEANTIDTNSMSMEANTIYKNSIPTEAIMNYTTHDATYDATMDCNATANDESMNGAIAPTTRNDTINKNSMPTEADVAAIAHMMRNDAATEDHTYVVGVTDATISYFQDFDLTTDFFASVFDSNAVHIPPPPPKPPDLQLWAVANNAGTNHATVPGVTLKATKIISHPPAKPPDFLPPIPCNDMDSNFTDDDVPLHTPTEADDAVIMYDTPMGVDATMTVPGTAKVLRDTPMEADGAATAPDMPTEADDVMMNDNMTYDDFALAASDVYDVKSLYKDDDHDADVESIYTDYCYNDDVDSIYEDDYYNDDVESIYDDNYHDDDVESI